MSLSVEEGTPRITKFLNLPRGTPPIQKRLYVMTLQEFKTKANVEKLEFYSGANGTKYCPTSIGTVFTAKDYNPKGKIQNVLPSFDTNGRQIWRITNQKAVMSL